jgi:hypothetical protein
MRPTINLIKTLALFAAVSAIPASACSFKPSGAPPAARAMASQMALAFKAMPRPGAPKPQALPAPQQKADPSIVGLWFGTVYIDGQEAFHGYETWSGDGTEILIDDSAPATDNVCIGVWVQTGPLTYRLKHPSWNFDMNGNLLGTVMITEDIDLANNGTSYYATIAIDEYDTMGNFLGRQAATIKATRITTD